MCQCDQETSLNSTMWLNIQSPSAKYNHN